MTYEEAQELFYSYNVEGYFVKPVTNTICSDNLICSDSTIIMEDD